MAQLIVVDSQDMIPALLDIVHDCYFESDAVVSEPEEHQLRITFRLPRPERSEALEKPKLFARYRYPEVSAVLIVSNVVDCAVRDKAQIGLYTFNHIQYDEPNKELTITADPKLKIVARVSALLMTVSATDSVLAWKTTRWRPVS